MRSIERRFQANQEKNMYWSTYTYFADAIRAQGFTRIMIHRWFNKLVDRDDYANKEKKELLLYLESL